MHLKTKNFRNQPLRHEKFFSLVNLDKFEK